MKFSGDSHGTSSLYVQLISIHYLNPNFFFKSATLKKLASCSKKTPLASKRKSSCIEKINLAINLLVAKRNPLAVRVTI